MKKYIVLLKQVSNVYIYMPYKNIAHNIPVES